MATAKQIGERIEEARRRRGMTQAEVATKLGVSRSTYIATERGERRPSNDELMRLKDILDVSLARLLHEHVSVARAEPLFRKGRSGSDDPRIVEAQQRAEDFARKYVELERLNGVTRVPAPLESLLSYQVREDFAERDPRGAGNDAARTVRAGLGLGDGPLASLEERLEIAAGLRIFHLPLPSSLAAFFFWGDELGACVVLAIDHPRERRRFSLAHEMGHFLRDRERGDVLPVEQQRRSDPAELFADEFAVELLMPSAGVARHFHERRRANGGRFGIADVLALADLFEVSFEAMTWRLEELRLLRPGVLDLVRTSRFKPEQARRELGIARKVSRRPLKVPERYVSLALTAFESALISEGELASYLDVDRVEARALHLARQRQSLDDATVVVVDLGMDLLSEEK